jgi:hypothetical protein
MVDTETGLVLERDEPAVREFVTENGGTLKADAGELGVYWLTLRPRQHPDERYYVRVAWSVYPGAPPSVKFATGVGGALNVTASWPNVPGYRPGNLDICAPFTAEGFATHPEWRTNSERWPTNGNPFLWVAQTLQNDLDNRYGGRSG